MQTANERLADAAVEHAIDLTRYSNGVVRRLIALLNRTDADLFAQLIAALDRVPQSAATVERLDDLLYSVRELNRQAYQALRDGLESDLRALAAYESDYQLKLFEAVVPAAVQVHFKVAAVSADQVYAAAVSRPFQGRLLKEWAASIEADRMARIRDAIRMGFIEGETIDQMVRRIRGTRARGYEDGLIEIDRRHAQAVVRTAVTHTANAARHAMYGGNADLIKGVQWVSTLDGRTTSVCQARDGKVYPLDSGPRPPAHWNCRSSTVPLLKSWRELGIDVDELPPATRASMDGQVPEGTTYQTWLKGKPAAYQDEVLGPSRAKLFRDGGLTLDRFVDRAGKEYTLDELRKRDALAFAKAGL
ncbi:minor capsid protein [Thauera humireducens]|uniref:phage head morphogenesis protein n=1 Tax=Thauera humireducens TaxID=1134435 RepID=UPI00311E2BD7